MDGSPTRVRNVARIFFLYFRPSLLLASLYVCREMWTSVLLGPLGRYCRPNWRMQPWNFLSPIPESYTTSKALGSLCRQGMRHNYCNMKRFRSILTQNILLSTVKSHLCHPSDLVSQCLSEVFNLPKPTCDASISLVALRFHVWHVVSNVFNAKTRFWLTCVAKNIGWGMLAVLCSAISEVQESYSSKISTFRNDLPSPFSTRTRECGHHNCRVWEISSCGLWV